MNMHRMASVSILIVLLCTILQIITCNAYEISSQFYVASAQNFESDCKIQCPSRAYESYVTLNYTTTYRQMILEHYGDTEDVKKAILEIEDSYEGSLLDETFTKTWNTTKCFMCDDIKDAFNNTIDRAYYTMDNDCNPMCKNEFHYYHRSQYDGKCIKCDSSYCTKGEYLTGDTCQECMECVKPIERHWEFTTNGLLDDNMSCAGQCEDGYFEDIFFDISSETVTKVCSPHQELECAINEYEIKGTHLTDSYCETCGECEGMNQTKLCSKYHNAVCEICDLELEHGAVYIFDNCTKQCLPGYVKNKASGLCEHCLDENGKEFQCVSGFYISQDRQNCTDCRQCEVTKPMYSEFVQNCNWKCVDGYALQNNTCQNLDLLIEQQEIVQYSSVMCSINQQLDCNSGRRICTCKDCSSFQNIIRPESKRENSTWRWIQSRSQCKWECMPTFYFIRLTSSMVDCVSWEYFQKSADLGVIDVSNIDEIPIERVERREKIPFSEMMLFLCTSVFTISFLTCTIR
jgi:hypothetical protein